MMGGNTGATRGKVIVQIGVGHYGVFSRRKWNQQIYPRVREMIHSSIR